MGNPGAFTHGKRLFRAIISWLWFPVDLVRLTGLHLSLTLRFIYRTYLCTLWDLPKPTMDFYLCRPRPEFVEWDNKKRFAIRRTTTIFLLQFYSGIKNIAVNNAAVVTLTVRQYLRMGFGLGLTWIAALAVPAATWKTAAYFVRSADAAADYKRDADELLEHGAYDRARIQYLNAVQHRPFDREAQWGLAQCAMKLKYFPEARKALERVMFLDDGHREARTALIDLLLRQGQADAALKYAEQAVKMDGNDVDARVWLGKCQQSLGRRAEARRQADAALRLAPDHGAARLFAAAVAADDGDCPAARQHVDRAVATIPEAELDRLVVARILGKCGDYAAAQDQLNILLSKNPTHWVATQELAEMRLASGDMDAAIRDYEKLSQLPAADDSIRIRLAELFLAAGRLDEAHAAGETLVRQMPHNKAGHMVLAMVYYLKGLWIASAENCRSSLKIAPKSVPARTLLARVLMRQINFQDAAVLLKPMQIEDWSNQEIQIMLAECYVEQNNRKAAFELLDAIQTMNPTSDAPHLLLARLHVNAEESEKAVADYRKALELNPQQTVALNNLATLLSSGASGDDPRLQEAEQLAIEAWRLRPDNPEIADTLGWIQALRGDYYPAVSLLNYAARLLPRQPRVRYHLAYAYAGLNLLDEAAQHLDAAVDLDPVMADGQEVRALRDRLGMPGAVESGVP